ncbi:MAG: AmmeMemoRadiSam system protein B [Pseudomonadota bacterium]
MRRVFTLTVAASVVAALCLFVAPKEGSSADSSEIPGSKSIRKPAVAGMFYPAGKSALETTVGESLKSASKQRFPFPVRAILAPHAGYVYCGRTIAAAFKQIEGEDFVYDRVVMLGPSHRVRTKAAALSSADSWETPLGPVPVDGTAVKALVEKSDRIVFDDAAHANEHALEVLLPYLVVAARGKPFKIVPILTNSSSTGDQEILGKAIAESAADPGTLLVLSSDLSHYPAMETAEKVDREILAAVTSLKPETLSETDRKLMGAGYAGLACTMCGIQALQCFERAASALGIRDAKIVDYTNSGMVSGDHSRVVGYGAVVFTGHAPASPGRKKVPMGISFSGDARKELIAVARSAVQAAVNGERVSSEPADNADLQVQAGCFVTLKNKGRLRGCIGRFTSDAPLWKTVRDMAVSSATEDTRFMNDPIAPSEVPELDIEVSVLSPMEKVSRPLEQIVPGRHGIVVKDKGRSGTFLPQVATETGWTVEEFLGHCSKDKAGLGWYGWKSPTAEVFTYTAEIVDEKDLGEIQSKNGK